MNQSKILGVAIVSLLIAGCASEQSERPEMQSHFVTNIDQQGSKRFSYSVTSSAPEQRRSHGKGQRGTGQGGKGGGMRGGGRGTKGNKGAQQGGQAKMVEKIKGRMTEQLETKLAETGFCREGYFEIDSYFSRGRSFIKGECKEGANDLDRTEYANG